MAEMNAVLFGEDVIVGYSGHGSDLIMEYVVNDDGDEINLDFASPASVELYAELQSHDYEKQAAHNEWLVEQSEVAADERFAQKREE